MSKGELVKLSSYYHGHDAFIAKSFLESHGIDAFVTDDEIARLDPFYTAAVGGVRLMVASHDLDEAKKLLELHKNEAEEKPKPKCLQCDSTKLESENTARNFTIGAIALLSVASGLYWREDFVAVTVAVALSLCIPCLPLLKLKTRCLDCGYTKGR